MEDLRREEEFIRPGENRRRGRERERSARAEHFSSILSSLLSSLLASLSHSQKSQDYISEGSPSFSPPVNPAVLGVLEETGKPALLPPSPSGPGVEEGAGEVEEAGVEEVVRPRVLVEIEEEGVADMLNTRSEIGRRGKRWLMVGGRRALRG